ncbi:hypothetical protein CLV51_104245 [Chitinophaga niastensis]|uniref:Uncharacterized protein n=1 Tax=Chitinophaga niastensis TaxID=536980 RepID=A0A2P8HH75_CHINA|nr:hypothetical protein CLV51_104245 [Chitinophaga niastensis]
MIPHNLLPDKQHNHTCDACEACNVYDNACKGKALADDAVVLDAQNAALADVVVEKADAVEPEDVENVRVPVALVVQVVCVVQKLLYYLLSTSRKLKIKTSSWHFFFVIYTGSCTPTYSYGYCFITLSAIL